MRIPEIVLICLASALLSGCCDLFCNGAGLKGSGVAFTEERDLDAFSALDVAGAYSVKVTCGEEQSFSITGDDNIVPLVITKVRGSTLHVYTDEKISPETPMELVITCKDMSEVTGSGVMNLDLSRADNERLDISLNGAGTVAASGRTGSLRVTISGAGSLVAQDLKAEDVSVTINGTGNAAVFASRSLRAEINGTGHIGYAGEPRNVHQRISGMGSVSKM